MQDGAGALLEALGQPVGVLQAVGNEALVRASWRSWRGADLRRIAVVDQHARQRVGVQLDVPAAVRPPRARCTSATSGWIGAPPKARPGLGSSARSSATMSTMSSCVDAAQLGELREIASRDERQIGDERLHRRVDSGRAP